MPFSKSLRIIICKNFYHMASCKTTGLIKFSVSKHHLFRPAFLFPSDYTSGTFLSLKTSITTTLFLRPYRQVLTSAILLFLVTTTVAFRSPYIKQTDLSLQITIQHFLVFVPAVIIVKIFLLPVPTLQFRSMLSSAIITIQRIKKMGIS